MEKLQEENRLLKQKLTHVSAATVSLRAAGEGPGRAWGRLRPQATLADTHGPERLVTLHPQLTHLSVKGTGTQHQVLFCLGRSLHSCHCRRTRRVAPQ